MYAFFDNAGRATCPTGMSMFATDVHSLWGTLLAGFSKLDFKVTWWENEEWDKEEYI